MKIVAIVPCYRSSKIAPKLVANLINYVDFAICVDDCCPENTGIKIQNKIKSDKKIIYISIGAILILFSLLLFL